MAAQRIAPGTGPHVVAGNNSRLEIAVEVSEPPQCCVTPMAHKEQTRSAEAIMRYVFQRFYRNPANLLGKFQRERFEALAVFLQVHSPIDREIPTWPSLIEM